MRDLRSSPRFRADRSQIAGFVKALFRYADDNTFISLRAFDQADRGRPPLLIRGVRIGDDIVGAAEHAANFAANSDRPAVFAPPIATFRTLRGAKASDVANGVAISVDLDHGDAVGAKARLEALLGPCTVVVASGGQWVNGATGEVQDKLHGHWRLSEPTRTSSEHTALREARYHAAVLSEGDRTAAPPAHPLRWPGSWSHKGSPRLALICAVNANAEIHLGEALEVLRAAVERRGARHAIGPRISGPAEANMVLVADAVARIPNPDVDWHDWNRMGMALYRASSGSQDGLRVWIDWSCRSRKHVPGACEQRWAHYVTSPPSSIGAGTLFHMAAEEDRQLQRAPTWRQPGAPEFSHE